MNISKKIGNFLVTGNLGDSTSLANIVGALTTPVEQVMLVKISCFTEVAAWIIVDSSLNSG